MIGLLVIPKYGDRISADELQIKINGTVSGAREFIGPRYTPNPIIYPELSVNNATLVHWIPKAQAANDSWALKKGRWCFSTSNGVSEQLIDSVSTGAGRIKFIQNVWGSFATILGDKNTNRILAWNTTPALEAIHYAEDEHFIYVSNRPLLIALAMHNGSKHLIQLNLDYAIQYLNLGYSVSGITPFKSVRTLSPRSALSICGAHLTETYEPLVKEPVLEEKQDPRQTGAEELAEAFINATSRAISARGTDRIQLRLSGGLDSRIILGLMRQRQEVEIMAVTQGDENSEEVMVAAELARVSGTKHMAVIPSPLDPDSFVRSLEKSIRESQGLIPSESLVAPYENASPFEIGENLVAGQWPLFKGVMDKTNKNSLEYVYDRFRKINRSILTEELNLKTYDIQEQWMASVAAHSNLELLRMHGRDLRSSRYLQPHAIQADAQSKVMYPFCDSEVVAISDVLPNLNRMQNISAFLAVQRIWPDALKVPTAKGGAFKFESAQPMEGISGEFYSLRRQSPPAYAGEVVHLSKNGDDFESFSSSPLTSAAKYLRKSTQWNFLVSILSPTIVERIQSLSQMTEKDVVSQMPSRVARKNLNINLNRIILVDLWLTRAWL